MWHLDEGYDLQKGDPLVRIGFVINLDLNRLIAKVEPFKTGD